jgi:hypothetical protein
MAPSSRKRRRSLLNVGEPCDGNPEPSLRSQEGVTTRQGGSPAGDQERVSTFREEEPEGPLGADPA